MTLTSGSHLGNYEIVAPIGAGGMGEVYRARDPRLGRDVAIKVLPEAFAADPERLARLQREAQMLAALNHPNIAGIHALEESGAVRFLVLEFVPGETLAELLSARGAMAVDEALGICGQLAEALEAAHERGIIHRDLKPANIKLTPEGKVKVLDFGLAKAFASEASGHESANSPTLSLAATRAGVLLGTAAYMSPEQARGKHLDRRTDIWAFGCVLFELLTGKQAFAGDTVSDAVAVILTRDPDWQSLPASTPPRVRELLRRCFQKDAGHRLRDMGDARIEIEEMRGVQSSSMSLPIPAPGVSAAPAAAASLWARPISLGRAATVTLGFALLVFLLTWLGLRGAPPAGNPLLRVSISSPEKSLVTGGIQPIVAISPDAQRVVFVAGQGTGSRLYMRSLDQSDATPIPDSKEGRGPFFSPDGEWIGFFAEGKLKKVSIRGGNALALCDASPEDVRGGSWSDDGWIYFVPNFLGGVFRIRDGGGKPEPVTTLDETKGERTHRWPEILPGGKALLFTIGSAKSPDYYFDAQIAVKSLATGQTTVLVEGGTNPHYLSTGYLMYATSLGLAAVPFDMQRLEVTGHPISMPDHALATVDTGAVHYAISQNGVLAYLEGSAPNIEHSLMWMDMDGKPEPLPFSKKNYFEPVLSPDGKRIAVVIPGPRNDDIWVLDIARNTPTRLTFGPGSATSPLWTPDGTRIVYSAERDTQPGLFWKSADGSGVEERLLTAPTTPSPDSFSPDGKLLVYSLIDAKGQSDIHVLPLEGDRKPKPFLATPFNEGSGRLSPDGRWIAYVSNESGSETLYVQPFPGPGGKWQLSTNFTNSPQWSPDGKAIFYRAGGGGGIRNNTVQKVEVTTKPSFSASAPKLLFSVVFGGLRPFIRLVFSLSPDSKRILMVQGDEAGQEISKINLVFGWTDEVKRRAASGNR